MKNVKLIFEVPEEFKIGECGKCPFRSGSDGCFIEEKLTNGDCRLNCFCRLLKEE